MNCKTRIIVGLLFLLHGTKSSSTRLLIGNGTSPFSFNQTVLSKVFDRASGTFYVGLANGAGEFAISKVNRAIPFFASQQFTGIASNTSINGSNIPFLTLATTEGSTTPLLAGAQGSPPTMVFALHPSGSPFAESTALKDAVENETTQIVEVAANKDFIFAAVRNSSNEEFGEPGSGIAVCCINRDTKKCGNPLNGITQTAAQAGDPDIKAKKLDAEIAQVQTEDPPDLDNTPTILEPVIMHWDDKLQRLYTGFTIGANHLADKGAKAVVVARVINNTVEKGILELDTIVANSAITCAAADEMQEIIVGKSTSATPTDLASENDIEDTTFQLQVKKLAVLHASTGPSYFIVNGGNQTEEGTNTALNKIFALPLVDKRDSNGCVAESDEKVHGTLADKNAALSADFKFVTPATVPGDLVTDPTINISGDDAFALVGQCQLPLRDDQCISDMVVAGDTVYVSIDIPASNTNDAGIFYSQALFGTDGKIISWTPWTKRAYPYIAFPGCMNPCRVKFFSVDLVTGNIIAVGGDEGRSVTTNFWDHGNSNSLLVCRLNEELCKGSYSALDLDGATRGFDENEDRYALFGGAERVIFTRISRQQTVLDTEFNIKNIQSTLTDYCKPENFLVTHLPHKSGCVTSLEYARRRDSDTTAENFFFAGTEAGLFVFAGPGGTGFSASELTELDQPPFTNGLWFRAQNISGSVVDIKTSGQALYVLVSTTSPQHPFKSKLYRIPFASTVNTMFPANTEPTVIAETGVGTFNTVLQFNEIEIVSTTRNGSTEQLVLATNNGLYQSMRASGVQDATNQTNAAWLLINDTGGKLFKGVSGTDPWFLPNNMVDGIGLPENLGIKSTVWPFNLVQTPRTQQICLAKLFQLNGTANNVPFVFIPKEFLSQTNFRELQSTFPIINFWTDGARRFFIVRNKGDHPSVQRVLIFPYDTNQWNVCNLGNNLLTQQGFQCTSALYWIRHIGMTGIIMAGTHNGVIALE